jgi:hypothetical protein
MKILTTDPSTQDIAQKSNVDNYYLIAMLFTAVLFLVFAYYDQIVGNIVR